MKILWDFFKLKEEKTGKQMKKNEKKHENKLKKIILI